MIVEITLHGRPGETDRRWITLRSEDGPTGLALVESELIEGVLAGAGAAEGDRVRVEVSLVSRSRADPKLWGLDVRLDPTLRDGEIRGG